MIFTAESAFWKNGLWRRAFYVRRSLKVLRRPFQPISPHWVIHLTHWVCKKSVSFLRTDKIGYFRASNSQRHALGMLSWAGASQRPSTKWRQRLSLVRSLGRPFPLLILQVCKFQFCLLATKYFMSVNNCSSDINIINLVQTVDDKRILCCALNSPNFGIWSEEMAQLKSFCLAGTFRVCKFQSWLLAKYFISANNCSCSHRNFGQTGGDLSFWVPNKLVKFYCIWFCRDNSTVGSY